MALVEVSVVEQRYRAVLEAAAGALKHARCDDLSARDPGP
jgi:hypothetical protein